MNRAVGSCFIIDASQGLLWSCSHVVGETCGAVHTVGTGTGPGIAWRYKAEVIWTTPDQAQGGLDGALNANQNAGRRLASFLSRACRERISWDWTRIIFPFRYRHKTVTKAFLISCTNLCSGLVELVVVCLCVLGAVVRVCHEGLRLDHSWSFARFASRHFRQTAACRPTFP